MGIRGCLVVPFAMLGLLLIIGAVGVYFEEGDPANPPSVPDSVAIDRWPVEPIQERVEGKAFRGIYLIEMRDGRLPDTAERVNVAFDTKGSLPDHEYYNLQFWVERQSPTTPFFVANYQDRGRGADGWYFMYPAKNDPLSTSSDPAVQAAVAEAFR